MDLLQFYNLYNVILNELLAALVEWVAAPTLVVEFAVVAKLAVVAFVAAVAKLAAVAFVAAVAKSVAVEQVPLVEGFEYLL